MAVSVYAKKHFGRWWRYGGRWRLAISILLFSLSSFFFFPFSISLFFPPILYFSEDVQRLRGIGAAEEISIRFYTGLLPFFYAENALAKTLLA